jgi:hypothetical protein
MARKGKHKRYRQEKNHMKRKKGAGEKFHFFIILHSSLELSLPPAIAPVIASSCDEN